MLVLLTVVTSLKCIWGRGQSYVNHVKGLEIKIIILLPLASYLYKFYFHCSFFHCSFCCISQLVSVSMNIDYSGKLSYLNSGLASCVSCWRNRKVQDSHQHVPKCWHTETFPWNHIPSSMYFLFLCSLVRNTLLINFTALNYSVNLLSTHSNLML